MVFKMKTLNFRYTDDTDVTIKFDCFNVDIIFHREKNFLMKITYRKYFKYTMFYYDIFESSFMPLNYVRTTAKDGNAFIARIYKDGIFYAIRKKKRKPQIVFMKSGERGVRNYQLGKDIVDAVCFYKGVVSRDETLLNDFFERRPIKEFNEEEYINGLNPEDKKEYLEDIRIDSVIEQIGKKYNIGSEKVDHLNLFIKCMSDDSVIKKLVLNSDNIDEIAENVLPLLEQARRFYEKDDTPILSLIPEDEEYTVDRKYIFEKDDFDSIDFHLNGKQMFVYDLLYFFEDEYEQVKEYLDKGIERTKKTIDEVLPLFKKYMQEN